MADEVFRFEYPSKELIPKIYEEINGAEGKCEIYLKQLKDWISCQPHLPQNYDDEILIPFIISSKYDLAKAKHRFENAFIMKHLLPELFDNIDVETEDFKKYVQNSHYAFIPQLTPEGNRVTFMFILTKKDYDVDKYMRRNMVSLTRLYCDPLWAGDVYVYDCSEYSTSLADKVFSPSLRKVLSFGIDFTPTNIKQIHLINVPKSFETLINVAKAFMKEKWFKKLYIHENVNDLKKYLPDYCIPVEYGGAAKPLSELSSMYYKFCVEHREIFEKYNKIRINAEKIPEKLKEYESSLGIDGVEGTFRQLNID